jgi:hypothetical protein
MAPWFSTMLAREIGTVDSELSAGDLVECIVRRLMGAREMDQLSGKLPLQFLDILVTPGRSQAGDEFWNLDGS